MSTDDLRMHHRFKLGPAWRWLIAKSAAARGDVQTYVRYGPEFWQVFDHLRGAPFVSRTQDRVDHLLDVQATERIFCDPMMRLQVEARLLARLPPDAVAAACGVATQIVLDYCDVFFDILDNLEAKTWLAVHIFDPKDRPVSDLHAFVCHASYRGGPMVCEYWLAAIPHLDEECDLSTARGREIKRMQLALMLRRIEREAPKRLFEVGKRTGYLSRRQARRFSSLSDLMGKRSAQVLGKFLSAEKVALPFVQSENDSHINVGGKQQSA
ncbi:hypothetical protein Pla22_41700 [Rubripirellula amarantea]|uniref:Uncharacterized protein n=2 Tax=Rubripirellula amarantea TaxID=2527999 RepID=A0A5C5WNJ7_9BACT|nr:hypothetical protein Pla22_41700 [Rubripirellula amarantea]